MEKRRKGAEDGFSRALPLPLHVLAGSQDGNSVLMSREGAGRGERQRGPEAEGAGIKPLTRTEKSLQQMGPHLPTGSPRGRLRVLRWPGPVGGCVMAEQGERQQEGR